MSKLTLFKRLWLGCVLTVIVLVGMVFYGVSGSPSYDTPLPSFHVINPFINSNKYTSPIDTRDAVNTQGIRTEYTEIETVLGTVHLDLESLAFQLENKNGYLWSTTIDYDDPDLPNTFKQRTRSALILESYNTASTTFAITEENLFTAGTEIETVVIENGFSSTIRFGRTGIRVTLNVTFSDAGILVEIPQEQIDESGNFLIASIKVYPYFGAVYEDEVPGYVFVPDGIGALVRYKPRDASIGSNYQKEIYDRDLGYNIQPDMTRFRSGGTRVYAPVFGFVHGVDQNAVFANIIRGAEYGLINIYYPSRTRGYTTVFSEFVFRRTYRQPIDKAGNSISLLQRSANDVDIAILYTLLENENANYVGMAVQYRAYLSQDAALPKSASNETIIPLRLDTIGIEKVEGLLFTRTIVMTTFEQFRHMIDDLGNHGLTNVVASFNGFTAGGVTWSAPLYEKIASRLGNAADVEALQASANTLYFVTEYMKGSNRSSGFNRYFDLAKKINDQLYQYHSPTDVKYLLDYDKVSHLYANSLSKLDQYAIDGLAIMSMGSLLYADFGNDRDLHDQIAMYEAMLTSTDYAIALYDVNSYLFPYLTDYFDFPMYSSQYVTLDDTVPFLAIVLKGRVDLFGPYANFYPYARDELLRLIDFGVYPSFVVTEASSKNLQETALESIYSSRFTDLQPAIIAYYDFVNGALKHVMGAEIIHRDVLAAGLVEIGYDNGITLLVNYTSEEQLMGAYRVGAKNYRVIDEHGEVEAGVGS
ncbi:MAG: hypothetical protein EA374_03440 [Acholeplasmatales bacterium]|nr:MAG: hypothetical protein EA374_03440 [Acholeplasmatales bacterium]